MSLKTRDKCDCRHLQRERFLAIPNKSNFCLFDTSGLLLMDLGQERDREGEVVSSEAGESVYDLVAMEVPKSVVCGY